MFLSLAESQNSLFLAVWDVIPQDQKPVVISFLKHLQLLANREGMQHVRAHLLMSIGALLVCVNSEFVSSAQHAANGSQFVMMLAGLPAEAIEGMLSMTH